MKQYNTEQYLKELGWDDYFSGAFESMRVPDSLPGRVVSLEKESCQVLTESGELFAGISGKMRFHTDRAAQYPSVGDWVVIQPLDGGTRGLIHAILPRKTKFSRRKPGSRTDEQVVAANVDVVFLVSALDGGRNLNLRRIERYLAIARNSGAAPVIVLNKTDLCDDVAGRIAEVETAAYGIPICAVSAITRTGLDALRGYLSAGMTAVLLGQSGVGKSAIINALLGEERLAIGEVRESDREGRHTTTRRQLILLPGGGAVIDSPGLRQIQVWGDEQEVDNTFEDISEIAAGCRFNDCRHNTEPGCAVKAAIMRGELDANRLKNYFKLQREASRLTKQKQGLAALEEKMRWKRISQFQKRIQKTDKHLI